MVLIGVGRGDTIKDADFIADKIVNLRIFEDGAGKMNLRYPILGAVLAVPQFTLYGDARKGRRPTFMEAALRNRGTPLTGLASRCVSGESRLRPVNLAHMIVRIINDGPCK